MSDLNFYFSLENFSLSFRSMGIQKKKHASGAAKNFVTRTQALRKLQVTLADFRRLCIFKGIYPREPRNKKKANKGKAAPVTFYYAKDIQYLMHEPILYKFREHKTFAKKLTRALGKGEVGLAKRLEDERPRYQLDRVIKERYPSFLDAVRDIDDALNMLFLFANMPATSRVSARITKDANELTNQWLAYVARERCLKKVFVSIKGVYYSATVRGEEVRWLVPFKFPQNIPSDVDFKVMQSFLEFYSTLVHFVLFKLYSDAELVFPPRINENRLKGIGGITTYVLETEEGKGLRAESKPVEEGEAAALSAEELARATAADNAQQDEEADADAEDATADADGPTDVLTTELDEFKDTSKHAGDLLAQPSKYANPVSQLFSKFTFFVGREVPTDVLEFVILAAGGRVVSEAALDEMDTEVDLSNVTHQIVDRPKLANRVQGRVYIQPQWVFDSLNKGELLNVGDYAVGETLPPHLSPWGDAGTYDPTAPLEEDQDEEEEEVDEADAEALAERELELEARGVKHSDAALPAAKRKAVDDADEDRKLKMAMMSNKQRKLYKKMHHGLQQQEARRRALIEKRKALSSNPQ